MRMKIILAALLIPVGIAQAQAAEPVLGRWMTDDRAAIVRIGRCGASVCGVTERVLDPKAPRNDIKNPDPRLRGRAIVGTTVLSGFREQGDQWAGGEAYSPKLGRSFRATMKVMPDRRLRVTGCLFLICRSIYWTRAG